LQSRFLHTDDTKTWNAFRQGNQAAFAYIYQAYFQPLYNYGRKFSSDDALIGDTLQQLFTELWQRRKRLGATDQIRNYLYKSFRRALLRNLAKQVRTESSNTSPFNICLSHEAHLIQQQHNRDQINSLQRAITQLTKKQREVVYLKFYDGLTYAEISEVMGIAPAQAYDFMYKALKSLRKNLKDSDGYNELTSTALLLFFVCNMHLFL
jgi:RNA polymerase sigma factor (sigma-70 family)